MKMSNIRHIFLHSSFSILNVAKITYNKEESIKSCLQKTIPTDEMKRTKKTSEQTVCLQYYDSPCGEMILGSTDGELCLCDWNEMPCATRNKNRLQRLMNATFKEEQTDVLRQTMMQLDEYFAGRRKTFSIPLRLTGTDFQKSVWRALLEIPYGETRSYKEIAMRVNNLKGVRAVAQAVGANGMSIIIPCHRVVGSDNSLTGFAGGLEAKKILLGIERNTSGNNLFLNISHT